VEAATIGKVVVAATSENISDFLNVQAGRLPPDQVRSVTVPDALVDTGAKLLGLPKRIIQQLGLNYFETRRATTGSGVIDCNLYCAVWLTIEGRRCTVDVAEVDDRCQVLIGYVPLELLDLVVDPAGQRLVPNPKDGGQQVLDLF
jgi:predicted aspartyl protease